MLSGGVGFIQLLVSSLGPFSSSPVLEASVSLSRGGVCKVPGTD